MNNNDLGQPSQDPRPIAQEPITPEEAKREVSGVAAGGGAVAGAAGGVAIGTAVGGPVGALVGGLLGAVAGAVGAYAAVDATDPDYSYWKDNYRNQPEVVPDYSYEDDYAPAYRLGYQGRQCYGDQCWEDAEAALQQDWDKLKGKSRLSWEQAKRAGRAAWDRVERTLPGDADGDGR